jgi:hypothetical protein
MNGTGRTIPARHLGLAADALLQYMELKRVCPAARVV